MLSFGAGQVGYRGFYQSLFTEISCPLQLKLGMMRLNQNCNVVAF